MGIKSKKGLLNGDIQRRIRVRIIKDQSILIVFII